MLGVGFPFGDLDPIEGTDAVVDGKLLYCLLYQDSAGTMGYREYTGDFTQQVPMSADCGEMSFDPAVGVCSCSASVGGDRVETKVSILISGSVYCNVRETVVTNLAISEEKPKLPDEGSALVLYFCDSGECIWDIAKRYNTSPSAIMEENGLEDEVVSCRSMLLIPSAG